MERVRRDRVREGDSEKRRDSEELEWEGMGGRVNEKVRKGSEMGERGEIKEKEGEGRRRKE